MNSSKQREEASKLVVQIRQKEKELLDLIMQIKATAPGTYEQHQQIYAQQEAISHIQTGRMWAVRACYNDAKDHVVFPSFPTPLLPELATAANPGKYLPQAPQPPSTPAPNNSAAAVPPASKRRGGWWL